MPTGNDYLTTKEVAELLRIKERKVYDLAAEEKIPCTRATGKLLFERTAINQWLVSHSSGHELITQAAPSLFAGSHDPLLEWAIRESRCGIPTLFDGSMDGLDLVLDNRAGVSAVHIYTPETSEWNTSAVSEAISTEAVVLVRWVVRKRGIVSRAGSGAGSTISGIADMSGRKLVQRQPTSGSQLLLEHLLSETSVSLDTLDVVMTARSEADLVLAIAESKAECGLGLESLAQQHELDFLPLVDLSLIHI